MMRVLVLAVLAALAVTLSAGVVDERSAQATTFTVTRTDDPPPDGCLPADCSLREAIIAANAASGADTIDLPPGTYRLTLGDSSPGLDENASLTGDLDILDSLVVTGADAATTIVDATGLADRVIHTQSAAVVQISGVTIRNGAHDTGAGVYNTAELTISDSVVSNNTQEGVGYGAGITNDPGGDLTIRDTEIHDNVAEQYGAGIGNALGASLLLERVTLRDNSSPDSTAGAVFNNGQATIRDSLIEGNSANYAGAIHQPDFGEPTMLIERTIVQQNEGFLLGTITLEGGSTTIRDSAVVDNDPFGGIFAEGTLTLEGSTVANNGIGGMFAGYGPPKQVRNSTLSGNGGPGLYVIGTTVHANGLTIVNNVGADEGGLSIEPDGAVIAANTIVAGSTKLDGTPAVDCTGTVTSLGRNLIGSTSGCTITGDTTGNIYGVDPMLGPLADNGGPTLTHAPLIGSPAINAGSPAAPGSGTGACELTDQRGIARPQSGRCDIGAVEVSHTDTDGDGCTDAEENGAAQVLGGQRNANFVWDFYDVNATKKVDAADIGLVRSKFNQNFSAYDRSAGAAPWAPGPPDGIVNAVDIGLVRASFNHNCQAPP